MSATACIVGFKPPDAEWKKMKEVWDACARAKIAPPREVNKFFNDEEPDDNGIAIGLLGHPAITKYSEEMRDGLEVNLARLPPDIKILRFYISY